MNKINVIFIIYILTIIMLMFIGLIVYTIKSNNKHKKKMEEIAEYQIHVTANIDSNIPEILSLIIKESFDDYCVMNLLPLNEGYINSERESEIRRDLVKMVSERISTAALDKLSLFYNIKNIAAIIADKIYITVMNYVTNHNQSQSENKK